MARELFSRLVGFLGLAAIACTPGLRLRGDILDGHPSILEEIMSCAESKDVQDTLGFDPLEQDVELTLFNGGPAAWNECRVDDDATILLNVFTYIQDIPSLGDLRQRYLKANGPFVYETKEQFQARVFRVADERHSMLTALADDPEMARWYRCGTITHELAELQSRKIHSYGSVKHGVSTRIETTLYTHLYNQGKISRELWERLYDFTIRFKNTDHESPESIAAYRIKVIFPEIL